MKGGWEGVSDGGREGGREGWREGGRETSGDREITLTVKWRRRRGSYGVRQSTSKTLSFHGNSLKGSWGLLYTQ